MYLFKPLRVILIIRVFKKYCFLFAFEFQVHQSQRASLPDSTGDQPQTCAQGKPKKILPPQSTEDKLYSPNNLREQSQTNAPDHSPSLGGEQRADPHRAPLDASHEAACAVCRTGGKLLRCNKCPKLFHLTCHVPALLKSPRQALSGEIVQYLSKMGIQ